MIFLIKLLVFVCLTALAVNCQRRPNNKNLVAVVQVFRHGQRTPVTFYSNDPYSDKSYWNGLDVGQLTNEGKRQHYALGQFTRRRYGDWLSSRYDKDDFYAWSTDYDRAHMSGQSNLNGLYPARGDQRWRLTSDWQPIPLHPADSNIFSALPATTCTNYYKEWANVLASPEFAAIEKENADLYAYLTENTGDNITSLLSTVTVWDSLKIEKEVRLRLPRWTQSVYPQPLTNIVSIAYESGTHTTQLKRFVTGTFLNEVVEYFEGMAKDSASSQKYHMYSGHDSNIAAILNSFDAYSPPYPPDFASTIYMELRNGTREYYVNVWSKNKDEFIQVSVRGCALDCPLNKFKERLSDIIIDADTFNLECSADKFF